MQQNMKENLGLKPSISIILGVGWLIFVIIWLAFYATDYPWEKTLSLLLLSILILFLLLGGMWAIWSIRKIPKQGWEMFRISGFRWRVILSIIIPFAAIIFLIIWFWSYAEPFSIWQNIAVLLVSLLVVGGILGSTWAYWSMKHGDEMKHIENICQETDNDFKVSIKDKDKK